MSSRPGQRATPPRFLLWWESLDGGPQALIGGPPIAALLALVHVTLLNQPTGRGIGYGLFWAVPATWAVIAASKHERRKRQALDREAGEH